MAKRYQVSGNKHLFVFLLLGVILGILSYFSFAEKDIGLGIGFGLIALLEIGAVLFFMPYQYLFDKDGVTICYLFMTNQCYRWKNIHSITVEDFSHSTHLVFWHVYQIHGRPEGNPLPFHSDTISKTLRAKRLIKQYWHGKIDGYCGKKDSKKNAKKCRKK